jgi:hypothetical protein
MIILQLLSPYMILVWKITIFLQSLVPLDCVKAYPMKPNLIIPNSIMFLLMNGSKDITQDRVYGSCKFKAGH